MKRRTLITCLSLMIVAVFAVSSIEAVAQLPIDKEIELTKQNLLRLGDIVAEVSRQLSSLKRQAQRASRYRNLKKEIKHEMVKPKPKIKRDAQEKS